MNKQFTPYGNLLISHKEAGKLPKLTWKDGRIEVLERKLEISESKRKELQSKITAIRKLL